MARGGIYLHIPFCENKCIYCDFCSYACLEPLHDPYVDALFAQIEQAGAHRGGVAFDTLFVGGGTPTTLGSEQLAALIAACRTWLELPEDAEATVEANPGTVTQASLEVLRRAGYNRLSIGVQSLHDDELALLGRIHNAQEAYDAIAAARAAGFSNLSLDLMYGLPHQSMARWQVSLDRALALAPEHLSLYALTVEEHTPLAQKIALGALPAPDDDLAADMYELAQERLSACGYAQYEISNWARRSPGDQTDQPPALACQHNLHYWRNEPYLGLGVAAHGYDGQRRYAHISDPGEYVRRVAAGESTLESSEEITRDLAMDETMMMGLRLANGVTRERFRQRFGVELDTVYAEALDALSDTGLLEADAQGIRLTPQGYLLGNRVFAEFMRAGS
jgi:oxygen-independent coproporphyrinogen III oxidase